MLLQQLLFQDREKHLKYLKEDAYSVYLDYKRKVCIPLQRRLSLLRYDYRTALQMKDSKKQKDILIEVEEIKRELRLFEQ